MYLESASEQTMSLLRFLFLFFFYKEILMVYIMVVSTMTYSFKFEATLVVLQRAMQGFTEKIVGMMKSENLFESQGGPIILSQV